MRTKPLLSSRPFVSLVLFVVSRFCYLPFSFCPLPWRSGLRPAGRVLGVPRLRGLDWSFPPEGGTPNVRPSPPGPRPLSLAVGREPGSGVRGATRWGSSGGRIRQTMPPPGDRRRGPPRPPRRSSRVESWRRLPSQGRRRVIWQIFICHCEERSDEAISIRNVEIASLRSQ